MKKVFLMFGLVIMASWGVTFSEVSGLETKGSSLKLSFSERFRLVTWDNTIDLDASQNDKNTVTRYRTSLMVQWMPRSSVGFTIKLTNEFRYYFVPEDREFNLHEVFFDQLYVRWTRPGKLPLGLTLGRQNIMLGEGFVVMDGHPLDGSRSVYFNTARMDVYLSKQNELILFYSYVPETDDLLPVINDQDQPLIEQPEEGIGVYFSGKCGIDAYFIRKNVRSTDKHPVRSEINMVGGRVVFSLGKDVSLTGEGAYQFGTAGDFERSGLGGMGHLDYAVGGSLILPKSVRLGTIFLSGDDSSTGTMEGWDPLFSRWPKWSESYIYTLIREYGGRVAYWSNLASIYGTLTFQLLKPMKLDVTYHRLMAPEPSDTDQAFPGGGGKTRGNLFITKFVFKLFRNVTGHLLWERFCPGNFYRSDAVSYDWFRCELMYTL